MPIKSVKDPRKCRHEEQLWKLLPQTQPMRPRSHNPYGSQLSQKELQIMMAEERHKGVRTLTISIRSPKRLDHKGLVCTTRYRLTPQKQGGEHERGNKIKQIKVIKNTREPKKGITGYAFHFSESHGSMNKQSPWTSHHLAVPCTWSICTWKWMSA